MEKEIINAEFDNLLKVIDWGYFPGINSPFTEHFKSAICYCDSSRPMNRLFNYGYSEYLQNCIQAIITEIAKKTSVETIKNRGVSGTYGMYDSLPVTINVFNKNVTFFKCEAPMILEDLFKDERPGLTVDGCIGKLTFDHIREVLKDNNGIFVWLCRKTSEFDASYDENKYLFLEEFVKAYVSKEICDYLFKKVDEFNKYLEHLETYDGYKLMVQKNWDHIWKELYKSIKKFFLDNKELFVNYDMSSFYNDGHASPLNYFFDRLEPSSRRHLDWLASFYSSEMLFDKIGYLVGTDNTPIVAGYLKSIEQLLANLIIDHSEEYDYFPKATYYDDKGNRKYIIIDEKNWDSKYTTLGSISIYIRESGRFIPDKSVKDGLLALLKPWREDSRNGYLHKDAIHSYKDIVEIRKGTIRLTLLILKAVYEFR